jgi:ATP-dependent exoDNAse (exonuclease V) beta subunit
MVDCQEMITFHEHNHTYTNEQGIFYTPVSTVIKHFKAVFDEDCWSKRKALERGITQEEILAEWSAKRIASTTKGTAIHNALEKYFLDGTESELIKNYLPTLSLWKKADVVFEPEKLIWNEEYKVAGTADMVIKKGKNSFSIFDYKTNQKIDLTNKFQKMAGCCSHLDDCNLNHYSLQLNIYAYLLSKMLGIKIDKLTIIHLTETVNLIPVKVDLEWAEAVLEEYNLKCLLLE